VEERAELAVADLERAGGFDRANLLVATTTGSGWLDSGAVDSFEYLTGGDSAVLAMQYSYLPSWLSYLVDQKKAREAGHQLFDAVYDRWSKLSPANRPRLFVFGLSLGSFGGETAFSGEYDLRNRTAGALFAGPPNVNTLYREFTDHRDRAATRWSRSTRVAAPSASPTTWSPGSRRPRRPGTGRGCCTSSTPRTRSSGGAHVPDGHGHIYTREFVDGWADILQPPGWTPDKAERLRDIVTPDE
jgi:uncharacterized membrane protein